MTAEIDEVIHQPLRLKIMAALAPLQEGEMIPFVRLKTLTGATDGNLSHQLKVLADAGHVLIVKDFHRNRPRTRIRLTPLGRRAFADYVENLRALLEAAGAGGG